MRLASRVGGAHSGVQPSRELDDVLQLVEKLHLLGGEHHACVEQAPLFLGSLRLCHADDLVLDHVVPVAPVLPDAWQDFGGDPVLEDFGFLFFERSTRL